MAEPAKPLLFGGETSEGWFDWLNDNYHALDLEGKKTPGYVMIVGGPSQVPFAFQSLLHTVASVGRLDFDDIRDLNAYVAPDSGWVLQKATGINDDGQIVGTGSHNGNTRGFLLAPVR